MQLGYLFLKMMHLQTIQFVEYSNKKDEIYWKLALIKSICVNLGFDSFVFHCCEKSENLR